jgi:quercetin dioxygenase-like cupin family protein
MQQATAPREEPMSDRDEFHNIDNPEGGILRELAPGIVTHIFSGEQAQLSVVTLGPNAQGTLHQHPEEQWGLMLEGSGVRTQGGVEIPIGKGDFWRTPGNVPHTLRAGPDGARVLDIFSPPRPEYKKPGRGYGG